MHYRSEANHITRVHFPMYGYRILTCKELHETGTEAMFADLSHFSVRAIQVYNSQLYIIHQQTCMCYARQKQFL